MEKDIKYRIWDSDIRADTGHQKKLDIFVRICCRLFLNTEKPYTQLLNMLDKKSGLPEPPIFYISGSGRITAPAPAPTPTPQQCYEGREMYTLFI